MFVKLSTPFNPLLLTLTLGTVALSGCENADRFIAPAVVAGAGILQATTLDESDVKQMSSQAAAKMDAEHKVAPPGSKYDARLRRITRGQELVDGLRLNYKVYLSDQVNAFAMADGTVRVYSGLLDAMPDDQVLAVIQHEIGHVALEHTYDQMREKILASSAFQAAAASGGTVGSLTQGQLGQLAYAAVNARFSQKDEIEADTYAVKRLAKIGQDPAAMKRSIQTLKRKFGDSGSSFLSSHPSNSARIENIEKQIQKVK